MKRLFAILLVLIFLITSVGAISAADSITVKVSGDMPDQVTVSLLCDGKIVDTAKLTQSNGFKTTFNVNDDGNYYINTSSSSDYSFSVSGNSGSGFIIVSKQIKEEVLTATNDDVEEDTSLATDEDSSDDVLADDTSNDDTCSTDETTTADETAAADETTTDDETSDSDDSTDTTNDTSDSDNETDDNTTEVTSVDDTQKDNVKKVIKQKIKHKLVKHPKKNNATKVKHNTGLPVVLVLVAICAMFVPFSRRKN